MSKLFGARYIAYIVGKLCKSEFSVLPLIPTSSYMLFDNGFYINVPINIAILELLF